MHGLRIAGLTAAVLAILNIACNKAPSDQTLTTDIQARLYGDAVTKPANVSVGVKAAVVTLSGDVASADVALEAMKVANGTPGVKGVKDQMTVNGAPAAGVSTPASQGTGAYPPLPASTAPTTQQTVPQSAQTAPAEPAPEQVTQPAIVTVPAGEHVTVRMIDSIDSARDAPGRVFRATLAAPLVRRGRVVVPVGTPVSVLLANARSAGRIEGRSELEVRLSRIDYRGHSYPVASSIYEEQGKARGTQTAVRTGVGAAAGAIIGAIAGGGKGAAIGSAAGGGAGFGVNVFTHGQQVRIPSEAVLTFRLERPLRIQQ
jgi:hypothetical protein